MAIRNRGALFSVAVAALSSAVWIVGGERLARAQSGPSDQTRDTAPGSATDAVTARPGPSVADIRAGIDRTRHLATAKTQALRAMQRELAEARDEIDRLAAEERELTARARIDDDLSAETLAALVRLRRQPAPSPLLYAGDPLTAVRGAVVLRSALRHLDERLRDANAAAAKQAALRQQLETRQARLEHEIAAVDTERQRVLALLSQRAALIQRLDESSPPATTADLEHLVGGLAPGAAPAPEGPAAVAPVPAAFPPPAAPRPPGAGDEPTFSERLGSLPFPAFGRVTGRFGEIAETGLTRKGLVVETAPDAVVVAPFAGRVVFAGPFRGYGRLLIIDHGGRYHTLLAGLGQILCVAGQVIGAGEPIAMMASRRRGRPDLYIEFRHGDRPIDPLPWFSSAEVKVRG